MQKGGMKNSKTSIHGIREKFVPLQNGGLKFRRSATVMNKTSVIIRFAILGILWLALVALIVMYTKPFTLYTAFVIVASAIIIFVPMYKKYVVKKP